MMSEKYRYEIIIYWSDEDQAFIAEVPELPGCMADGSTYAEAIANVEVIIDEWVATAKDLGREIPEPKGRLIFA
jgi:predicted RNase H-like HicB family nuclease